MRHAQLKMKSAEQGAINDGIGAARQIDMRHIVGDARIPLIGKDRLGPTAPGIVTGVMKCVAAFVITTCTEAPALVSARVNSAVL